MEASIARSHLKAAGVESFLLGVENEWNTAYRLVEGVRLMVIEEELDEAAAILAKLDSDPANA